MDEIFQWIAVVTLLAIAIIYIIRKLKRKGGGGCCDCGLSDCCSDRKCDTDNRNNKSRNK